MKKKLVILMKSIIYIAILFSIVLTGCVPAQPAAPAAEEQTSAQAPAEAAEIVVTRLGKELPADALPLDQQVLHMVTERGKYNSWDTSVYDTLTGGSFGIHDSCTRTNTDFELQPNACTSWETSEDGLTWTFHLQEDKVWSDGVPITADDWVFSMQRYARADYDFEWFYSMAGIINWSDVVNDKVAPEELGVKKVDDYTFTVTTESPVPYLIKLFSAVWVVPMHIVKDRNASGEWALDPKTAVSAGPYKLEKYDPGKSLVWVANEKYTGAYPPMIDRIEMSFMDPDARFNAYKAGELDILGTILGEDLPPSAMAQIMADPELKKQLITWPNFITYYLFMDNWTAPFDNLKVRQAFSHAIDRDAIVNGPLQYQSQSAYTMNPPGFPGESVDKLKDIQNFDPQLAAKFMEEAGFPQGKGFPDVVLYTREASPAITNAAEAIGGMLKENLGVNVSIQNLDYSTFTEKMSSQKSNGSGDFKLGLVSYEFDFVDGSNLLGVWGGCAPDDVSKADNPGRHTWQNVEYNKLLCQAGSIFNDENKRNEIYQQAEKLLIDDVALIPIYHGVYNVMVRPEIKGAAFNPNKNGKVTFWRYEFSSSMAQIYKSNLK